MFKYCAYSGKGTNRNKNSDRVMVDNVVLRKGDLSGEINAQFMAVVCDGVGNTNGGTQAAERIVNSFKNFEIESCSPLAISRHLHKVNREIVVEQRGISKNNMASTVAGLVMVANRFLIFWLGDTRIYKFYDRKINMVTRDHTEPGRDSSIISYVGGCGYTCFPSFKKGVVENGCIFLMCSDGIYKSMNNNEIITVLGADTTIEEKMRAILMISLQNGSTDDNSLVLVECVA